jgi:uncharacterized membrane protein
VRDKVLEDLKGMGGTVIRTSFDDAKEEALKAALAAHGFMPAAATPEVHPAPVSPPPVS